MPQVKHKEVSRVFIYHLDEISKKIYGLLVQRPEGSGRNPDLLSLLGGTNAKEVAEKIPSDWEYDPHIFHLLWHLQNEIGISFLASVFVEVSSSIQLEEDSGTFIEWTTVNYMVRLNNIPAPTDLPSFADLQAKEGKFPPRPIEWFELDIANPNGIIFWPQGKAKTELRPINGQKPAEGFGEGEIAFDQYEVVQRAVAQIKELQKI